MRVVIFGSGGRELAMCKALRKFHPANDLEITCVASNENPGIEIQADKMKCYSDELVQGLNTSNVDLCLVGSEKYLEAGLVDILIAKGIPTFGPTKAVAQLETSKSFARNFLYSNSLSRYSPEFGVFPSYSNASNDDRRKFKSSLWFGERNLDSVIKKDGLSAGKGVFVQGEHFNTFEQAEDLWKQLDAPIVVEKKLLGEEFSLMTFTDGEMWYHMPIVRDYKRLNVGNTGPNTGGMGSVTFADHSMPFLSNKDVSTARRLNEMVIREISKQSGVPYRGVLYGGYMKTTLGEIKLIEFNCRFGDPEAINVLHLLESDFLDICWNVANGTLSSIRPPLFRNEATYCRYYCPPGYPDPTPGSSIILNFSHLSADDFAKLTFANLKHHRHPKAIDLYETHNSRCFAIIESGFSIAEAEAKANETERRFPVTGLLSRNDIGHDLQETQSYIKHLETSGEIINSLKRQITTSWTSKVLSRFGDYAGVYELDKQSGVCLVTSVDGVGSKTDFMQDYFGSAGFEQLGYDLVNHCVNDILVKGAHPLFFTDYFASAKLDREKMHYFLEGVSSACRHHRFPLISGESAEMQGTYAAGKVDLVGNIVGMVNRKDIIDGKQDIRRGDIVFGLRSEGPHTNGYTVIRKLLQQVALADPGFKLPDDILQALSSEHKCYLNDVQYIRSKMKINGLIHITGGGFVDNPPRVLRDDLQIVYKQFEFPPVFKWIQEKSGLSRAEMMHIFNCGYGMLVVVSPENTEKITSMELDGDIIGYVVEI